MRTLLSFFAAILIIGWVFAFLVFAVAGPLIHLLLVIALVVIIMRIIGGRPVAG
jgi:hypothetical protein